MNNFEGQQESLIKPEGLKTTEEKFKILEEIHEDFLKNLEKKLKKQNFGKFEANKEDFGKLGNIESLQLNLREGIESIIGRKPILEITQELIENGIPRNNNISVAGNIAFVLIDLRKMGLDDNPGIANLRSYVTKDIFLFACNEAMYGELKGNLAYDYITRRCDYLMKKIERKEQEEKNN